MVLILEIRQDQPPMVVTARRFLKISSLRGEICLNMKNWVNFNGLLIM